MKKIIISIFLILCSFSSFASVSAKETMRIYNQLISENYLTPAHHFLLVESNDLNGWVDQNLDLYITTEDLKELSKPEMALLLGHELAHVQFRDPFKSLGGTYQEDRADHYGMLYSENIGYSRCETSFLLLRIYKEYGNGGKLGDPHSKALVRFWHIYKGCK